MFFIKATLFIVVQLYVKGLLFKREALDRQDFVRIMLKIESTQGVLSMVFICFLNNGPLIN